MADIILTQLVNGLILGFCNVLIAIGLSVVFGVMGIANFAHGAFFALGAYFSLALFEQYGWPAVILAPFLVAGLGMVLERLLFRRLYEADHLATLILTIALANLIDALIRLVWGSSGQPFSPPPFLVGVFIWGPIVVTKYRLCVLAVTSLLVAGFWPLLNYTQLGRVLRAGARDPEMVGMLGINLPRLFMLVFGLGCLFAGIAGMLAAPLWSVVPSIAESAMMPAVVIVVIGGFGSYLGAVIAGLLVGVVTAETIQFWPEASNAAMYVLMALVLLVRPRGLFGEQWDRFE